MHRPLMMSKTSCATLRVATLAATLLAISMTGCYTGIRAKEVSSGSDDADGLRYYLPAPLLVVETIAPGKTDARVEFSLDRSRVFAVQPTEWLASNSATIEFNPDGTLKMFQLNQDSTEVAEAVVAGLRDLESKKLDLEKAALDARAAASAARAAVPERTPEVCVYQIAGENVRKLHCTEVKVEAVAAAPQTTSTGQTGPLSLTQSPDSSSLVLASTERALDAGDVPQLGFLKGALALSPADQKALRKQVRPRDRTLHIPLQPLRQHGVTKLRLGNDFVDLPPT